jgi:hypothetical protein
MTIGMLLMIMGAVLIGIPVFYFARQKIHIKDDRPSVPTPPIFKYFLYALAVGLITAAAYLFYSVGSSSGWDAFARVVFALIMFVAGVKCIRGGREADAKFREDMANRAQAKAYHTQHEEELIRLETARQRALEQARVDEIRRETEIKELALRQQLLEGGMDTMLTPEALVDVNVHGRKTSIDLQAKQIETSNALDAADRVDHYRIIAQLETELESLLERRRDIELNEKDKKLRKQKILRLSARISELEGDISERQKNRFLSAPNRPDPRRIT